jgi:HTH-type transcriptional regulator/antitoxin HigA
LAVLIEAYDDQHYPVARTTPQKIVDFMLGQKGMTRAELAPVLGGRSRVSEFFAKKRRLSITQIKKIRDLLGIPADLLIS